MNFSELIRLGQIQEDNSIKMDQAERLILESKKDLESAKELLRNNQSIALQVTYTTMFHAANALLRVHKLRPGRTNQHKGVISVLEIILGSEIPDIVIRMDNLRNKRNQFEYQALFSSSKTEIESSIEDAEKLIEVVESYIENHNPQKKLIK